MSTSDEPLDAFDAHFQRDPIPKHSGIRVIVLCQGDPSRSDEVAASLEALIVAQGRNAERV